MSDTTERLRARAALERQHGVATYGETAYNALYADYEELDTAAADELDQLRAKFEGLAEAARPIAESNEIPFYDDLERLRKALEQTDGGEK